MPGTQHSPLLPISSSANRYHRYQVDPDEPCCVGRHGGYSWSSAILQRFLGWSYRMWVGQYPFCAEPVTARFRFAPQKRHGLRW